MKAQSWGLVGEAWPKCGPGDSVCPVTFSIVMKYQKREVNFPVFQFQVPVDGTTSICEAHRRFTKQGDAYAQFSQNSSCDSRKTKQCIEREKERDQGDRESIPAAPWSWLTIVIFCYWRPGRGVDGSKINGPCLASLLGILFHERLPNKYIEEASECSEISSEKF